MKSLLSASILINSVDNSKVGPLSNDWPIHAIFINLDGRMPLLVMSSTQLGYTLIRHMMNLSHRHSIK